MHPTGTIDFYNVNLDDPEAWNIIKDGKTVGVFQLESNLGQNWSKKIKPSSIEETSDVSALLRPGCISEDVMITVELKNGNNKRVSMKELYFNQGKYKTLTSYNEQSGKFEKHKLIQVYHNGRKNVYRVKAKNLMRPVFVPRINELTCTLDHKILTPKGWIELKDLQEGDRFATVRRRGGKVAKLYIPKKSSFRDVCFKNYYYKCVFCSWKEASLDTNHLEGNRFTNNDPYNLCFLCPNHHKMYTEKKISKETILEARIAYELPKIDSIEWVEFVDKEFVGEKDVYDVSMEAPHHNFIAGNVVVHNCMNSILNGKSMTQHYTDRKHGIDQAIPINPRINFILEPTHQVLVYQEQSMEIAKFVAGFSLEQADTLRKAIGKKNMELMAEVEKEFIEGCKKTGIVSEDEAKIIFANIKESQKYAFNKSHSVSYSYITYWTALAKAKNPIAFICASMNFPGKQDPAGRIRDLIYEARSLNITVCPPNLFSEMKFCIKNGVIHYGLSAIKGTGTKVLERLLEALKEHKPKSFLEHLFVLAEYGESKTVESLLGSGYFDYLHISRMRMINEYQVFNELVSSKVIAKYFDYARSQCNTLEDLMQSFLKDYERFRIESDILKASKKNKPSEWLSANKDLFKGSRESTGEKVMSNLDILRKNPMDKDSIDWICRKEREILKAELTYSPLDRFVVVNTNNDCQTIKTLQPCDDKVVMAVEIAEFREYIITKGKQIGRTMCFLTIADQKGCADAIMFTDAYAKYKNFVYDGNLVLIEGKIGDKGSLIVDSITNL